MLCSLTTRQGVAFIGSQWKVNKGMKVWYMIWKYQKIYAFFEKLVLGNGDEIVQDDLQEFPTQTCSTEVSSCSATTAMRNI